MLQTCSNWKIDSTKNEKQWTAEQKWSAKNIQREGILLEQVHNLATIKIMTRLLKEKKKSRYMVWESTTWKTFDSKEVNTSYTKTRQESFIVHA